MIISSDTFDSFISQLSPEMGEFIENQLILMHNTCFGYSNWTPRDSMSIIMDIDEKTAQVHGFLNYHVVTTDSLSSSKDTEEKAEIYNVCVHPDFRNQGILGKMLNELPDYYYLLQVVFDNRRAYSSYLKYFFCDFLAIGHLSLNDTATFILGGRPSNKCEPSKRLEIISILDNIWEQIQFLESKQQSFQELFKHFIKHISTYLFIFKHWDLISQIVKLQSDKIRLSSDIISVLTHGPDSVNFLFNIDGGRNILELMLASTTI